MHWIESMVEKACQRVAKLAPAHRLITRGDDEPYLERYYFFRREWLRNWFKKHKVELLDKARGVWTIFIAGKRHANDPWGFWHPVTGLYQDWREHVSSRELRNNVVWRGVKAGEA